MSIKCVKYLVGNKENGCTMVIPNFETMDNSFIDFLESKIGVDYSFDIINFLVQIEYFRNTWYSGDLNEKNITIIKSNMSKRWILEKKLEKEDLKLKYLNNQDRSIRYFRQEVLSDGNLELSICIKDNECEVFIDFINDLKFF